MVIHKPSKLILSLWSWSSKHPRIHRFFWERKFTTCRGVILIHQQKSYTECYKKPLGKLCKKNDPPFGDSTRQNVLVDSSPSNSGPSSTEPRLLKHFKNQQTLEKKNNSPKNPIDGMKVIDFSADVCGPNFHHPGRSSHPMDFLGGFHSHGARVTICDLMSDFLIFHKPSINHP